MASPGISELVGGDEPAGGPLDDVDGGAGRHKAVVELAQLDPAGVVAVGGPQEEPAGPALIPAQPVDADQDPERAPVAADLLDPAVQPGARQGGHEQRAGPPPTPLAAGEEVGQRGGPAAPGGHGADDLLDGLGRGAAKPGVAVGAEEEVVSQGAALQQGA